MIDPAGQFETTEKPIWQRMLVPFAFVCLAAIPIMFYGTNSELAKWKAARAQLLYDDGEIEDGIKLMEQAVEQSPRDQTLKLELSRLLMPVGRADEALELIEGVIDNSIDPGLAIDAKSNCLLYLRRPEEALATLKEKPEFSVPGAIKDADRLNTIAYFRALAGVELDQAEKDINKAVLQHLSYYWWLDKRTVTLTYQALADRALFDQTLIAAAMLANQIGRPDVVSEALDSRISEMDKVLRSHQEEVSEDIYQQMQDALPIEEESETDLHDQQLIIQSQKEILAAMYTVRALLHQQNGEQEKCDLDRLAAESLDHKPDELLSQFPSDWELVYLMDRGAQFLDTRAMITSAQGNDFQDAIADLDCSILAMDVLSLACEADLSNTMHDELGQFFDTTRVNRSEATIRRHRADILMTRGKREQAEADLVRIRELGFNDDDVLF